MTMLVIRAGEPAGRHRAGRRGRAASMWRRKHRPVGTDGARVIVVGAGFAGLAAVERLARAGAQGMLVDRNVYSTFQPLLYQVAAGGLNPGDVAYPARAVTRAHGARFRLGELTGGDPAAQRITLADGSFAVVAPDLGAGSGGTAWGDAGWICPYNMYRAYGDTNVIADQIS